MVEDVSSSDEEVKSLKMKQSLNTMTNGNTWKSNVLLKLLWFMFLWQSVFHMSDAAVKSMLSFFTYFVRVGMPEFINGNLKSSNSTLVKTAEKYL